MSKLHSFTSDISHIKLPDEIAYPHNYFPHKIAQIASEELQVYLKTQKAINHMVGLNSIAGIGKMFGVLVVKDTSDELMYLAAFSGKILNSNLHTYFVPPVFDNLDPNNFYVKAEAKLNKLTKEINKLCKDKEYLNIKLDFENKKKLNKKILEQEKIKIKERRKLRKKENKVDNQKNLNEEFFLREYEIYLNQKLKPLELNYVALNDKINRLIEKRSKLSVDTQRKLFESYLFLNSNNRSLNLFDIYKNNTKNIPSGAGECCAPKLFQYAFLNKLKPIALAEFWWGNPLSSSVRKHKQHYPACKGKCRPILNHMLKYLPIAPNPLLKSLNQIQTLNIIYEDEYLMAINKPEKILSVEGKEVKNSIEHLVKKNYPNLSGPLIVHRLDMSTSGVLLIAKSKQIHKHLQQQFVQKKIYKKYVALLDGILKKDRGLIDLPLRVDIDDRPRQTICYRYGKKALTKWEKISIENNVTRVNFYPISGRTHQLRVHSAHKSGLNIPIIGDQLYGKRNKRLYLHAEEIMFIHPISKEKIKIIAPVPF